MYVLSAFMCDDSCVELTYVFFFCKIMLNVIAGCYACLHSFVFFYGLC